VFGGLNNHVIHNVFKDHRGFDEEFFKDSAPLLTEYMPESFFSYATASIIDVEYGEEYSIHSMFGDLISLQQVMNIEDNMFINNKHY
jgi:hypothetical protein